MSKHEAKISFRRNGFYSTFDCAKKTGMTYDAFWNFAKKNNVTSMLSKNHTVHGKRRLWKFSEVKKLIDRGRRNVIERRDKTPNYDTVDFTLRKFASEIKERFGCTKVIFEF